MKIQLASDLHLEFLAKKFPGQHLIAAHTEADVLVLAGDSTTGTKAIDYFRDWPMPVVYVSGNQENYGGDFDKVEERLRAQAVGTAIQYMERDRVDLDGIRFLGCALRTDYVLCTRPSIDRLVILQPKPGGPQRFTPPNALNAHRLART